MNELTQTRVDVAQALSDAGLTAVAAVPDRLAPPFVAVTSGSPYVEDGNTFNGTLVRLTVRILCLPGQADVVEEQMDDMICTVLDALNPNQWLITVGQPGSLTVGSGEYPAVDITITKQF